MQGVTRELEEALCEEAFRMALAGDTGRMAGWWGLRLRG